MPVWAWILIVLAVVVALGLAAWAALAQRRTANLRERFGPEYDRTLEAADRKRDAEAELHAREERREELEVRPLSEEARRRFAHEWQAVQAQFVDDPAAAVAEADSLIQSAMNERGYPVEDFDRRADDLSVDHPIVVANYREGHRLALLDRDGKGSTEDLRQAMQHYRALFEELANPVEDEPTASERSRVADSEELSEDPVSDPRTAGRHR